MRRKKTVVIGVISGVLCAVFVLLYLQNVAGEAQSARAEALSRYGGEQIEVCVAKRDIAAGETIDANAIETKLWVADLLPQDAVQSSDEVIGKQASSSILAGEVISLARFKGESYTLDVPEGLTAVSVPARDVQAVGGAIEAGMKVDIYATGNTTTVAIAENVLVLSTSASVAAKGESTGEVSWITLAVEPDMVQELVAAAQTTDLYFVLPADSDLEGEDE